MRHTNINIESPNGLMSYFVEYQDDAVFVNCRPKYLIEEDKVLFYDKKHQVLNRIENEWTPYLVEPETVTDFVPEKVNLSSLNIYFPRFSVETYQTHVKYALDICTFIHGNKVCLGSFLIDRNDVLACKGIKKFANEDYYEYININILDPWYITYSDDWKDFRQQVCGEEEQDGGYELNSTGSIIHITLHPVVLCEDNIYREMDDYRGSQNSINLADTVSDYLSFNISDNHKEVSLYEDKLLFMTDVTYNEAYDRTVEGFQQYIKETYGLDTYDMWMEVVVQDDTDVFKYFKQQVQSPWQQIEREDIAFDSWDGWHEGMFINVILHMYTKPQTELVCDDTFIYLKSNRINLTQELFRYLVGDNPMNKVFIDAVDMKTYNINAVNKIQQNIIQMERPDDYKANIIKPVFFRAKELANLVIHPAITENICINLDQYKSKVDTFIIRIEETSFIEYGRTAAGVIFKVIGPNLADVKTTGTYYILNQDNELVTTGQYTYEQ